MRKSAWRVSAQAAASPVAAQSIRASLRLSPRARRAAGPVRAARLYRIRWCSLNLYCCTQASSNRAGARGRTRDGSSLRDDLELGLLEPVDRQRDRSLRPDVDGDGARELPKGIRDCPASPCTLLCPVGAEPGTPRVEDHERAAEVVGAVLDGEGRGAEGHEPGRRAPRRPRRAWSARRPDRTRHAASGQAEAAGRRPRRYRE